MDTEALECVWNGAEGWRDGSSYGRGALLPGYDRRTAAEHDKPITTTQNPMIRVRPSQIRSKYSNELRKTVRIAYANGRTFAGISRELRMPISTVYNIVCRVERER